MKIITFNVNGIRSALNKGFKEWLLSINPDIICLQEIKLHETNLVEPLFAEIGYYCYWYPAIKKGYSGVSILSKKAALNVTNGIGVELYDNEGRTIWAEFDNFNLISAYFPSGTMGDVRQEIKMRFLDDIKQYTHNIKQTGKPLLVCGDVNICHTEIDIHNPKGNAKNSGFLPEEREWVGKYINDGFIDTFRTINKEPHNYTWWTYRAGARAKNLGWRIDYIFAANIETKYITGAHIYSDVFMSDHCPVSLDINI